MHESSLARQLLTVVLERARAAGARRVLVVRGFVADCENLSASSLELHFRLHAENTVAAGASLELELTRVRASCRACTAHYEPEHHVTVCPECGSTDAELLGRTGLGIHSMDIE